MTKDITLFAAWEEGEADGTLKGLTYRFGNHHPVFGYSASCEIPQARYEMVLGKTQGEWIYGHYGRDWGGNCYGMAATSEMFSTETEPPLRLRSAAERKSPMICP